VYVFVLEHPFESGLHVDLPESGSIPVHSGLGFHGHHTEAGVRGFTNGLMDILAVGLSEVVSRQDHVPKSALGSGVF